MAKVLFAFLTALTPLTQAQVSFTSGILPMEVQQKIKTEIARLCPTLWADAVTFHEMYTTFEREGIDQGQFDLHFTSVFAVGPEVLSGNDVIQPMLTIQSTLFGYENGSDNTWVRTPFEGTCY